MSRTSKRAADLAEILRRDHAEMGEIRVGAISR
jgi:hypothetical protein